MKHFLSEEDVSHITRREHPKFNRVRMLNPIMWLRILSEPELAKGLRYTAQKSESLIAHNLSFPKNPSGFEAWSKKLHAELQEVFSRF